MKTLRGIAKSLYELVTPVCSIVKDSPAARELALALGQKTELGAEISAQIERVRAEMRVDQSPHPDVYYDTIADHFNSSSSHDAKLAALEQIVRFKAARAIAEIGTAYGLSGITMAMAQPVPNLITFEPFEPQATLGPRNISSAVPQGVEFMREDKSTVLPRLAAEGRRFDLVFHDGGHYGDAYLADFLLFKPMLDKGAIYLIDDIYWDRTPINRAKTAGRSERTCGEGWQAVIQDPAVIGAIEYRRNLGIALLA